MSTMDHAHGHADDHAHDDHHPHGWRRWLYATNHKDIGTLYLWFSFAMLLTGGVLALGIRAELFKPGLQLFQPEFFNQLTTMHGLIMVFGAIMPAFVGFANWMIPLQIGAADMAFARMNNFSFWLLPPAAILLVSSFLMPGGATAAGWTLYAPLSTQMGIGMDMGIFAMHIMGASSIMGSINIVTTILNMRAPGMTLMKMPMFAWTWLITAYLLIAVMPVLAGAITMTLTDRHFGTSFFNAAGGGDPVMYQHIFWFFGHPEVYIMILPAFGIVSQIIPAFARKPLFGYESMVYATSSIAILSFIVWAHHMFATGMPVTSQLFFMYATMLIAVPTDWKATSLYADTSNRGVWIMRETSGLLATNVTSVGKFPDQTNRAMEGVTDRGALIFGIQGIGVIKSNSAYSFQASSTYVLSCMTVQRNGELSNNTIDIFLDPNSLTNVTGAIKIGTIKENEEEN